MSASILPADLELVIAVAVGRDDFFEAFRQVRRRCRLPIGLGARQRIDQPDGVARMDRRRRREAAEQLAEIEALRDPSQSRRRAQAGSRCASANTEAPSSRPSASMMARSISARPNDATSPLSPTRRAGVVMRSVDRGRQPERRIAAGRQQARRAPSRANGATDRNCPRSTAPATCRTISAPASRPTTPSPSRPSASLMRARTNTCGASRKRDDAEAERQAQRHRPLEEIRRDQLKLGALMQAAFP